MAQCSPTYEWTSFFTEEELSAARRELARMPENVLRRTHVVAQQRGVETVAAVAFLIREMRDGS